METTPAAPERALDNPAAVHAFGRPLVQCRACALLHNDPDGCPQCEAVTPHVAVMRPKAAA